MRTRSLIPCMLLAAALLAGCGSSSSSSTTSASTPNVSVAPPVPTGIGYEKVPVYEPAHIIVEHVHHVMHLNASATAAAVATYYEKVLPQVGWTIVAKSNTPAQTTFSLTKPGRHATITIEPRGPESFVTIHTPPS